MGADEYGELSHRIRTAFMAKLRELQLAASLAEPLMRVYLPLAGWIKRQKRVAQTFVLGINGAQGSGKTTLAECLKLILGEGYGLNVVRLSIDDFYKTHAERERLGREVHPLLVTRGVPGTHDVGLGLSVLDALTGRTEGPVTLPRFDKALDDRRPESEWPVVRGPVEIVLFEGWCVGATPQDETELVAPLNELERLEDADGAWRLLVNQALEGEYARWFHRLDALVMLKVPNMACVYEWRSLQEEKLAVRMARAGHHRVMDSSGLKRFIMHFERLTRHMLAEMPDRADVTLYLDEHHQFTAIHINH